MFCVKCGNEITKTSKFCPFCGEQILTNEVVTPSLMETSDNPNSTPDIQAESNNSNKNSGVQSAPRYPQEVQNQSVYQQNNQEIQPKIKKKKNIKVLIIVLIVIILAAGGGVGG